MTGATLGRLRKTQAVADELCISSNKAEWLLTLAGIEREAVGTSKLLDPEAVGRLKGAHALYLLAKSLPPEGRADLRDLFDRFRAGVETIAQARSAP